MQIETDSDSEGFDPAEILMVSREIPGKVPRGERAFEVYQVWGQLILDSRLYRAPSSGGDPRSIRVGPGLAPRWSFLGVDMGRVPSAIAPLLSLMPLWSEISWTQRHDFPLPDGEEDGWELFGYDGERFIARIPAQQHREGAISGRALVGGSWMGLEEVAQRESSGEEILAIDLERVERLVLEIGSMSFVASPARADLRAEVRGLREIEPSFAVPLSIAAVAFLSIFALALVDPSEPLSELREAEDRTVTISASMPSAAKRAAREVGAASGREQAREAEPERESERRSRSDREVAGSAGLLAALESPDLAALGSSSLSSVLSEGVSRLIGASGSDIGGHGLAGRGGSGLCVTSFGCDGGYEGSSFSVGAGDRGGHGAGGGSIGKRDGEIGTEQPILLGNLSASEIEEVIRRQMEALRYCYQRELQKKPDLSGKVVVKFTISKDGTVSSAAAKSSTLGSSAVEQCLVGRFLRMKFPEPKGGGVVVVSYPFLFSSR